MAAIAMKGPNNMQEMSQRGLDTDIEQHSIKNTAISEDIIPLKPSSHRHNHQNILEPTRPTGPPGGWLSHQMSASREIAFNFMVCMVQLIPQACLTTCFPIIQVITSSFDIKQPSIIPWVVAAYSLSFGTTILLSGQLGDIFGHKKMVVAGFIWLSIFSVVAGLSHYASYELFFVARAFQGVGAAMMNPNALALLGRSYPPGSKGKIIAFSMFALCAPLGAYSGMLASALIGQFSRWYWSFYATAIVCTILAIGAQFILPTPMKSPQQLLPLRQKLGQMDWLGGLTGVAGLVAVQISLICAPSQHWSTQYIFMLFIIGLLLLCFFVVIELKVASEPLVPFTLLSTNAAFVLVAMACGWGTFGTWTFYIWRFFLSIWHLQPSTATLYALPIVPTALVAAVLTAYLIRTARPPWILLWALTAFTLGPLLLAFNTATTPYWSLTFLSLLITPFGMDMSFPAATILMSNELPLQKQGVAGSLVTTVVNYSISLGLGLATTVEVHANDDGRDLLRGYQGGWWFGVALGALGVVICAAFVIKTSPVHINPILDCWRCFGRRGRDAGPGKDAATEEAETNESRCVTVVASANPSAPGSAHGTKSLSHSCSTSITGVPSHVLGPLPVLPSPVLKMDMI